MFTFLLRSHPKPPSDLLHSLTFLRHMGGGPRTFPGGLNKWKWKRLHEKQAKEKERKLLDQEKQLYQARIRTQIRAGAAGKLQSVGNKSDSGYSHMSAKDQVKALADRFMTEKAEDLWNEDDGPIRETPIGEFERRNQALGMRGNGRVLGKPQSGDQFKALPDPFKEVEDHWNGGDEPVEAEPVRDFGRRNQGCDMMGSGSGGSTLMGNRQNLRLGSGVGRSRFYSVQAGGRGGIGRGSVLSRFRFRKSKNSSSDDEDSDYSSDENDLRKESNGGKSRFPKFIHSEEELESELESEGGRSRKKVMGRGVLESYDKKKPRFVPPEDYEEECGLSEQVEKIREELMRRKLAMPETEHLGTKQYHQGESLLSNKRFDECNISPLTVKALTSAGYVQMTKVQEATISVCLDGMDALVKAKTGTGKSAAFLLPAIETVLKATGSTRNQRAPPILVLILCPTRELASQIAAEANVMLKHHNGIGVLTLIGGTRFKLDQKRLESDPSQIIVATPGRLLDHIENKSGFSVRLMGLKMLILDEVDRLLDLGFRKDIEKIVDCVPRQRQSLLLSATVPKEVRRVSQLVLKKEHAFIDTVGVGEVETHDKVKQLYYVVPHELHFPVVYQLLKEHTSNVADYKVIVFCTTSMVTSLLFSLLRDMKMNVREMHSRKPQLYRTRMSDEFRESKRLILVTSDVSARGMNYPDVTLVIQVGIPTDREQYIHRLGRTGREGKEGEGILLLAPWEEYFLDEIKDLPIQKSSSLQLDSDIKMKVKETLVNMDSSLKEAAYHAWLGYYNSIRETGRDKTTLVEHAKEFCDSIGLQNPPSLFRKTAVKMGLRDIPGIRIRK